MKGQKTVIEFGTSKIACASGCLRSKTGIEVFGYSKAPYLGIRNSNWVDSKSVSAALEQSLEDIESQLGARVRGADVGIPACFMTLVSKTVETQVRGRVKDDVLDDIFNLGLPDDLGDEYTVVNQFASWYMLDDGEIYLDIYGKEAKRVSAGIISVVANRFFIEDIETLMKNCGIRLEKLICEPFAHAVSLIPEYKRDELAVLVDVGYYNTNISLVYGDSIVYMENVETGGGYITNDIAYVLKVDMDTAEQLKRRYSFGLQENSKILYMFAKDKTGSLIKYPYGMLKDVIDSRTNDILNHVCNRVRQIERKVKKEVTTYITGGGISFMPGINSFVRAVFDKTRVQYCKVNSTVLSDPCAQTMYALLEYALYNGDTGNYNENGEKKPRFSLFSK